MKTILSLTSAALVLTAIAPVQAANPSSARPNIIIILADDIGSGDLSCYGSARTKTPNLDRLATEGIRCTDVHASASVCTASRYSLLTGRYAWRDGVTPVARPLNPALIPTNRINLASLLKSSGYTTGVVGKWHLGFGEDGPDFNGELKPGPLELGFDYYYGFPSTNDRVPPVFIENHRVVNLDPSDPIIVDERKLVGDDPTADTPGITLKLQPIGGHRGTVINGISRMGYMAGGKAARWVDEDMADVLTGKAVEFIERSKDRPFFLYFATHNVHAPLAPNARFRGTSKAGLWGDSVHEFDWSVGEVLKTLDRLGLRDNTLVIFSSDNGGKIADGYADPEAVASGHVPNAPWSGTKYTLFEGGHRVPFIARWPGHIPASAVSGEMFGLVDMVATCATILGQPMPSEAVDSLNALPALLEARPAKPVREWHISANNSARLSLRKGPWKFVEVGRRGELYNLTEDPAETTDLFAQCPEVVKDMRATLDQVRATVQPAPASQKKETEPVRTKRNASKETGVPPPTPADAAPLQAASSRPNVLLLVADDLAVRLGCYGDAVAKTPGLDRLAAEGVLFERAYAQGVVCTPSRKSFLTGLSTKVTGVGSNNYMLAHPETMTVSRYFRQHGYQTIGIGKVEHTMDFIDPQGWDIREEARGCDNRGKVRNFLKVSEQDTKPFSIVDVRPDTAPTLDMASGERLVEFWQKEWNREKPFFAALGFHTPHLPNDTQQRYIARHDLARMPLAATPADASEPLKNAMPQPQLYPPDEKQRQAIQGYYAAVSCMDAVVARLMDELRRQGLLDNTIILFTSDQGYHLGYRGLWCKHSLYPGTLQVPLLVRYPKAAASGARAAGIVELLDLFPTLAELAGLPAANGMQGESFARLLNDPKAEGKDAAFADDARGGHAVYTKDWAYIERQQDGEYELYNLSADPECFRNMAGNPEYADVRRRHSEQVNQFFHEQEQVGGENRKSADRE